MGWSGGAALARDIWDIIRRYIPNDRRWSVARRIVDAFEKCDCDTMHEAGQLHEDAAIPRCNLCGLTCLLGDGLTPATDAYGLIDARVSGGYESTAGNGHGALDDTTEYRFSLCEFCLDWLFSQFRLPVGQFESGCSPETWRPAEQRVRDDKWRSRKDRFFAEKARRDEARPKK